MKEREQGQTNAAEWGRGSRGNYSQLSLCTETEAAQINETYHFCPISSGGCSRKRT